MPDAERTQERLDNIRTVQPIVSALRTISLGSWQAALNRLRGLQTYTDRLQTILLLLAPHLPTQRWGWLPFSIGKKARPAKESGRGVILIIGSERGLCGGFNDAVVDRAQTYYADHPQRELWVLGARIERALSRDKQALAWSKNLATSALPSFSLAFDLTQRWLSAFEAEELDSVHVVYNAYQGVGRYEPTVAPLIPPEPPPTESTSDVGGQVIVETDPLSLYTQIVEQWAAIDLYTRLLDSAAAEHATRYQLMEGAAQNAERLIEDLTAELQAIRRQQITQEMQELATGAGLLSDDED
jgi:F-type H+-transporting ATPase subunit gamma